MIRGDDFRFAVFCRDSFANTSVKKLWIVPTPFSCRPIFAYGRFDAQRPHTKPLEAGKKRSIIRPDIDTECSLGNSKLSHNVSCERALMDFKFQSQSERVQDRKDCVRRCDDPASRRESKPGEIFGKDTGVKSPVIASFMAINFREA